MPFVQRDLRRRRERPRVAIRIVPPPVQPPLVVDVILVVRILRHDRVQLRRRRAHVDPCRDGQLVRDVEGGVVGDLDISRCCHRMRHNGTCRDRSRHRRRIRRRWRRRRLRRRSVRAVVADLACNAGPGGFLEAERDAARSAAARSGRSANVMATQRSGSLLVLLPFGHADDAGCELATCRPTRRHDRRQACVS